MQGYFVNGGHLTKRTLDLLNQVNLGKAFISYRRTMSSAFALLTLYRLKSVGIDAFLDMSIPGGDDWNNRIRNEIESRSHFIICAKTTS